MIDRQQQKINDIKLAINKTNSAKLKNDLYKQLKREIKELKQAIIFLGG